MTVEIKFCGLTRPEDAAHAATLGAAYVGVIFAGGPRTVSEERARRILDAASTVRAGIRRVGVFAADTPARIARVAAAASLDVIQLHADPSVRTVSELRGAIAGAVWVVVRVAGERLPDGTGAMFAAADGVVLDARVDGRLGGTGVALPWHALAGHLRAVRGDIPGNGHPSSASPAAARARLVLAGGLRPANVLAAITELAPEIVDVSSGVESAPGIKDHSLMRAFAEAAGACPAGSR